MFYSISSILLGVILFSPLSVADENAPQSHPLQQMGPVRTYNPDLVTDVRVKASSTRMLKPGERVDMPYVPPIGEWIVQRLTERSYWIFSEQFAVTVFVGDHETLVIDAPMCLIWRPL